DALVAALQDDVVARWNYRAWWVDSVKRAWPDAWQAILAAGERQGPLTLRVNTRRASVDAYLETLRANGIEATAIGRHAVRLASALP
ncbi:16S rRNA (cytosine(967)-C(5))-methyltransferase RsmB, partial [Burkholderia contaminans]